tara:strand:+ start:610 stop:744 length:135 start_codon:yes stop_codon:yes gene_type:complete
MKQSNGNSQLNEARENVNSKVDKLKGLGKTKGKTWNANRRNRSI